VYVLLTQLVASVSLVIGVIMVNAECHTIVWKNSSFETAREFARKPFLNQSAFNVGLSEVLNVWDRERPGLVDGREVGDIEGLLIAEIKELSQTPDDPEERADVVVFCNRLMAILKPDEEWFKVVEQIQGEHLGWMVENGLDPNQVVGEKIGTNFWNYQPALFGKDGVPVNKASRLFLRNLRDELGNLDQYLIPSEDEDEFCIWKLVGLELARDERDSRNRLEGI